MYVDFNSLYPTTMSKFKLLCGEFKELSGEEKDSFLNQDLTEIDINGDYGYYLHIDTLPISPEIARKTDSFPLCLSKMDVQESDLSPYSKTILDQTQVKLPKPN